MWCSVMDKHLFKKGFPKPHIDYFLPENIQIKTFVKEIEINFFRKMGLI